MVLQKLSKDAITNLHDFGVRRAIDSQQSRTTYLASPVSLDSDLEDEDDIDSSLVQFYHTDAANQYINRFQSQETYGHQYTKQPKFQSATMLDENIQKSTNNPVTCVCRERKCRTCR